jgi:hypothetical protein
MKRRNVRLLMPGWFTAYYATDLADTMARGILAFDPFEHEWFDMDSPCLVVFVGVPCSTTEEDGA